MLTATACLAWAQRLGFGAETRAIITAIRSSPPSRLVRSGAGNVPARYPSAKMGRVIQAESHTVELPFVHAAEQDRDVLEYWDQPPPIPLRYRSKHGRPVVTNHTPDFFELRTDGAGWVECKPEERLQQLGQESPHRYAVGSDGCWHCPPGETYAAQFGLTYRVFSSAGINWMEQRNWAFLADYLGVDCPPVSSEAVAAIVTIVENNPGVTLARLLEQVKSLATTDEVNVLIATTRIYVDLRSYALAEPDAVPVFRDATMAQACTIIHTLPTRQAMRSPPLVCIDAGAPVLWDGRAWTIGNVTATHTPLISAQGAPVELLRSVFDTYVREGRIVGVPAAPALGLTEAGRTRFAQARPADLAEANRRYTSIRPFLEEHVALSACDRRIPERTKFAWAKQWRDAERCYGHGYLGLLPRSGNREKRSRLISDEVIGVLHQALEEHYATYRHQKKRRAYGAFLQTCQAQKLPAVSERTFYTEAARYLTAYEERLAREGRRAAYALRPPDQEVAIPQPRHGDRPWELAHLDHTEVDLELLSSRTGRPLGRAWVTMLIDAFTRRVLALYLTYAKPSYVSCMMALRLCVQRWGRLPRTMVVDGGAEFHSTYFETLLAWYHVALKTRPPAEPRYGSIGERLFGTANSTFIHTLLRNTQVMQQARQVTMAVNPKAHARWTLGDLYTWLCEWAYEVYDTIDHSALGQSPRAAQTWAEDRSGSREHTRIAYDRDFILRTLPTTRKGTAVVQPGHGIKIHSILYWCSAFDDPEVERTAVAVRYDPFDIGLAHAYLPKGQRWVECRSDYYALLHGCSERELLLIGAELRQAQRMHAATTGVTAKQLAEFHARVTEHEHLMLQRERDAETRVVLTIIQGEQSVAVAAAASPPEEPVTPIALVGERPQPVTKPKLLPRLR